MIPLDRYLQFLFMENICWQGMKSTSEDEGHGTTRRLLVDGTITGCALTFILLTWSCCTDSAMHTISLPLGFDGFVFSFSRKNKTYQ